MTVPGGGCRSLGCRGYLHPLLEARISLGTTTRFHRHLLQAHLLAMSLNKVKSNYKFNILFNQLCVCTSVMEVGVPVELLHPEPQDPGQVAKPVPGLSSLAQSWPI